MRGLKPLRSRNEGLATVDDIFAEIARRLPPYLAHNRQFTSDKRFASLPRDPEGNLISLHSKAYYNGFTEAQLLLLTQHDKDDIREALGIRMRAIDPTIERVHK